MFLYSDYLVIKNQSVNQPTMAPQGTGCLESYLNKMKCQIMHHLHFGYI